jgi:hypothetical protein
MLSNRTINLLNPNIAALSTWQGIYIPLPLHRGNGGNHLKAQPSPLLNLLQPAPDRTRCSAGRHLRVLQRDGPIHHNQQRLHLFPLSQELPLRERGARIYDVQQILLSIFSAVL